MGFQVVEENIEGRLQVAKRFDVIQFSALEKPLGGFHDGPGLGQGSGIEVSQALQFPVIACQSLPVLSIQPLLLQVLLRPGNLNSRLCSGDAASVLPSPDG